MRVELQVHDYMLKFRSGSKFAPNAPISRSRFLTLLFKDNLVVMLFYCTLSMRAQQQMYDCIMKFRIGSKFAAEK